MNISAKTPKVYILHENREWVIPLMNFLDQIGAPYEEWFINEGSLDLESVPPEGIFYNRMSASSHTRDHRYAVELAGPILAWLQAHGRRVINDRRAIQLEVRKVEQHIAINSCGLKTPRTIAVNSKQSILDAAQKLNVFPFIVKPNRGGKGTGVMKYDTLADLERTFKDTHFESLDGIFLVQQYVKPIDGSIVRAEFIGGKFYYAVRVDASDGFELCPADACEVGDDFCPTVDTTVKADGTNKFEIIREFDNADVATYERLLKDNGMEIAAIEYVEAADGQRYLYDINTNTNYNSKAEEVLGNERQGMRRIAEFLTQELAQITKNETAVPQAAAV